MLVAVWTAPVSPALRTRDSRPVLVHAQAFPKCGYTQEWNSWVLEPRFSFPKAHRHACRQQLRRPWPAPGPSWKRQGGVATNGSSWCLAGTLRVLWTFSQFLPTIRSPSSLAPPPFFGRFPWLFLVQMSRRPLHVPGVSPGHCPTAPPASPGPGLPLVNSV